MSGEFKDQTAATAAQVKAAETLFAIATGTDQETFLKVTHAVMQEVYGRPATQEIIYALVKDILQASTNVSITPDDTNHELDIAASGGNTFTPTKQNLFTAVAAILQASTNITITQDGTNHELDISATDTNTIYTLTKALLYPIVKQVLQASTNVTFTEDDTNNELDIAATQRGAPTKAEVYSHVKDIVIAGSNVTVTDNDTAETVTLAATQQRTTTTHSNLTTSYANILTSVGDNDRIEIYYKESAGSNYYTDSWTFRFGDLDTNTTRRVISASGNQFAILYKKSGTTLQMRQGGGLNASNFLRLTRYPNYYA